MEFTPDEPGTWLFHCHILAHVTGPGGVDTGMITTFTVK
jgi:FtsP/CotA-like multicopper oxidase with cupredoxin domain